MNEVCFVFASAAEKNPDKVINKYLKGVDYDTKFLHSGSKDKILKKDIDLDMEELKGYKIMCPIGADALKYVAGMTGIQKYNGVFIEKKYLPIMHPNICIIKPQMEDEIQRAFAQIPKLLSGEDLQTHEKDYCFIETQSQLDSYTKELEDATTLVVDIETTSVSPHTGVILGIAISTRPHQGLYVSSELVYKHKQWFHDLFKNRKCILYSIQ